MRFPEIALLEVNRNIAKVHSSVQKKIVSALTNQLWPQCPFYVNRHRPEFRPLNFWLTIFSYFRGNPSQIFTRNSHWPDPPSDGKELESFYCLLTLPSGASLQNIGNKLKFKDESAYYGIEYICCRCREWTNNNFSPTSKTLRHPPRTTPFKQFPSASTETKPTQKPSLIWIKKQFLTPIVFRSERVLPFPLPIFPIGKIIILLEYIPDREYNRGIII